MASFRAPDPENTPAVNPVVNFLSLLWLIPKREYLKRFRFGREVTENVAGNDIIVYPEVFNPVIFRTGKYFAELLQRAELGTSRRADGSRKRALDLGAGTGILGLVMARRGFEVDSVDINTEAVRCVQANVARNSLEEVINVFAGDLFEPVAGRSYDLITFSPPSFRGEPRNRFELCWRSKDVFERFGEGLPAALNPGGIALVLQTSHGDEPGLVRALLSTGMQVDVFARKHFGVEIFSVYRLRKPA